MIMQINGNASFMNSKLVGTPKKDNSDSLMLNKQQEVGEDSKVKNLQSQINALRDRIQELGENSEMDEKTKAELRQSYQEQMTSLRQLLNQRRAEARKEKLEQEQENIKTGNDPSNRTNESAPKRKYDTYEKVDSDSLLNAAVSAFNSVDIAKIHQSTAKSKNGKANVLEREAQTDTRLTQTVGVVDHETKIRAKAYSGNYDEDGNREVLYEGDVDYEQLEAWDEQGIYYIKADYASVIIGEEWHGETGTAVDAKLEEATELRGEAKDLADDDAKALGEANRTVNGKTDEEADKEDEKTEEAESVPGQVIIK